MRTAKSRTSSNNTLAELFGTIRSEIANLPGVRPGKRSFRIGQKIFVRFAEQPDRVFLEFKLPSEEAGRPTHHAFVRPMEFGGMGRHGWVEVSITRKSQLPVVRRLISLSHALYRQT